VYFPQKKKKKKKKRELLIAGMEDPTLGFQLSKSHPPILNRNSLLKTYFPMSSLLAAVKPPPPPPPNEFVAFAVCCPNFAAEEYCPIDSHTTVIQL
jgi:hypothetical protein